MFSKSCQPPLNLLAHEALARRLPGHLFTEEMKEGLRIARAGYRGEESTVYFLSQLDSRQYWVFYDLRIPYEVNGERFYFQIDVLLVTPTHLVVLEVKNYAGTLYFDRAFNQLVQTKDEQEKAFPDPVSQAKRLRSRLYIWMEEAGFPKVPIEILVVLTGSQAIIKGPDSDKEVKKTAVRKENMLVPLIQFSARHTLEILTPKMLRKCRKSLLSSHTPHLPSLLQKYSITAGSIQTGVFCPSCSILGMQIRRGNWHCAACGAAARDAHLAALQEYALLISQAISVKECLTFLQMPSHSIAYRLLQKTNYPRTGKHTGSYSIPFYE